MAENGKTSFSEQLDRMRQSMKKSPFAASQEYRAVMNALQDVVNYQGRSVGETSKEMVEAHSRLGQACETYLRTREGARTNRGKSRLDMVGAIYGLQQQERDGVNAMRTPSVLKDNSEKKWNEVLAEQRVREIDVTNLELGTVGAGSSTRTVVPMGEDIGFFTRNSKLEKMNEFYGKMAKETSSPKVKAVWEKAAQIKVDPKLGFTVELNQTGAEEMSELIRYAQDALASDNYNASMEHRVSQDHAAMDFIQWNSMSAEEKTELMKEIGSAAKNQTALVTMGESGKIEFDRNVPERNVATSRLADLLGQGNIIAKSEKMRLKNNGMVEDGVVMARAEGLDINDFDKLEKFAKVEDFSDPEFQRQITNMEIMDLVAGQVDRNVGNMFYQMADMENGKTRLTGVQGIDNDAAFGLCGVEMCGCKLHTVTMVDAGLKENLMKIDRATLEYTFGDILNKPEIDAMESRLGQVKLHLQSVTDMQPGDWNAETSKELGDRSGYFLQIKSNCGYKAKEYERAQAARNASQKEEKAPEETKKEISLAEMVNAEKKTAGPEAKPARENSVSGLSKKEPAKTEPRFVIGSYHANKGREK